MIELHGNLQSERCESCGTEYLRDFRVGPNPGRNHYTGRKCDRCGGDLKDYLVPFGEDLPKGETDAAWKTSEQADFCLVLGSSMTVTPACDYAGWIGRKGIQARVDHFYGPGKVQAVPQHQAVLAIVNIQTTPYDDDAQEVCHTFCDDAMTILMQKLGLELPAADAAAGAASSSSASTGT